jgi:hypothetical protein
MKFSPVSFSETDSPSEPAGAMADEDDEASKLMAT